MPQAFCGQPFRIKPAVAIVGSPQLTSYDLLLWQAELGAIDAGRRKTKGENAAMKTVEAIHNLHADTLELTGDCGHFSFICESEVLRDKVNSFTE